MLSPQAIEQVKWSATFMFVCAGTLISLNLPESKYAFPLFATGHIIAIYVFALLKDKPLLVQNTFFLCIDLIGIYQWLLKPIFFV
tara:strand:+ start:463 stop:717 length:255 start_codon:yes stop_codon:yes gene_type:complete